mgnify:CR=1 FL=1
MALFFLKSVYRVNFVSLSICFYLKVIATQFDHCIMLKRVSMLLNFEVIRATLFYKFE